MTPATRYLGASTPFGTITAITGGVYNPEITLHSKDGTSSTYRLPFLIALGVRLPERMSA